MKDNTNVLDFLFMTLRLLALTLDNSFEILIGNMFPKAFP